MNIKLGPVSKGKFQVSTISMYANWPRWYTRLNL